MTKRTGGRLLVLFVMVEALVFGYGLYVLLKP